MTILGSAVFNEKLEVGDASTPTRGALVKTSEIRIGSRIVVVAVLFPSRSRWRIVRDATHSTDASELVLVVDFAADSRSAMSSIRENFTDARLHGGHTRTRSSGFSKVARRKGTRPARRLIVDSPAEREKSILNVAH